MNRRPPRSRRAFRGVLVGLWRSRRLLLLVIPYVLLFSWLFSGGDPGEFRLDEVYAARDSPRWRAPDPERWFGTAADGSDLFEVSRRALAKSVAISVVAASLGLGLALLAVALFALDPKEGRFDWLERGGRVGRLLPSMVLLAIFTGGVRGGTAAAIGALGFVAALHLAPVLARWFREGESGFDIEALWILGFSRREIVRSRVAPTVVRRLPALFARLIPEIVLAEMALSYLGFTGDRLGLGGMVARGQDFLVEAPWMIVAPGCLATAVVAALSLLAWRVSLALRAESTDLLL